MSPKFQNVTHSKFRMWANSQTLSFSSNSVKFSSFPISVLQTDIYGNEMEEIPTHYGSPHKSTISKTERDVKRDRYDKISIDSYRPDRLHVEIGEVNSTNVNERDENRPSLPYIYGGNTDQHLGLIIGVHIPCMC